MVDKVSLALAQLNPTVGDIDGNLEKLRAKRQIAAKRDVDLLVTSELYLCGYPPEDLVQKPSFLSNLEEAIELLAKDTIDGGPGILLGTPILSEGKLYNGAVLLAEGRVVASIGKCDLPNYGPFDEKRVFQAAPLPQPIVFRGVKFGVLICEDMWSEGVAKKLAFDGADLLLVLNGSPFERDKYERRKKLAAARVSETKLPLVYLNQIGGQDELVFDGASFVLDANGQSVIQAASFREDFIISRWQRTEKGFVPQAGEQKDVPSGEASIYTALMLGLRDYVEKIGFPSVVLGLSGGIDSALVAALATDALGANKVSTVMMPSPFTSQDSKLDAGLIAKALGCSLETIPIMSAMEIFSALLSKSFTGKKPDITEENIQSRCRGLILMALSNKFGSMVLSTGNKSEMSVGYATLYGDMCGGFAALKDLYKTDVYKVAAWRNQNRPVDGLGPETKIIPDNVFTRPPTAELKLDQTDQDSLPPYDILDGILEELIENDRSVREIAAKGYDIAEVKRVWGMLDRAEYKRRQAPPGVKITRRNLSKDRRYPITNKYRET